MRKSAGGDKAGLGRIDDHEENSSTQSQSKRKRAEVKPSVSDNSEIVKKERKKKRKQAVEVGKDGEHLNTGLEPVAKTDESGNIDTEAKKKDKRKQLVYQVHAPEKMDDANAKNEALDTANNGDDKKRKRQLNDGGESKKARKSANEKTEKNLISDGDGPKNKRHRPKEVAAETEASPAKDSEVSEKPPKKKRKRQELSLTDADNSEHVDPPTTRKKKKRSSRKDTSYPDPSEDGALVDSARKALLYVHARVSSQPDWKFNKARQNWLIRNIWDDVAIPEIYFPSCLAYLAGVQGNTRELLVKTGNAALDAPASSSEPKSAASGPTVPEPEPLNQEKNSANLESAETEVRRKVKAQRAQAILAMLSAGVGTID